MASKFFNLFAYLSITLLYYVGILYDTQQIMEERFKELGVPYNMTYGGRYKYLTYLNMNLQLIYFNTCFVISLYELKYETQHQRIHLTRSFLYKSLTFPYAALVSLLFWILYFIDPALVFPKIVQEVVPNWCNHIYHTLPVGGVLVEAYMYKHSYECWNLLEPLTSIVFSMFYIICFMFIKRILIIENRGGYWVYPILEVLPPYYRAMFLTSSCFLVFSTYKMGHLVNSATWTLKTKFLYYQKISKTV